MTPEASLEVKTEAARRNLSLRALFEEMWAHPQRKTAVMEKKPKVRHQEELPRKIVGFVMTPEAASEVKAEAARRNLSLRALFEEMWLQYNGRKRSSRPRA